MNAMTVREKAILAIFVVAVVFAVTGVVAFLQLTSPASYWNRKHNAYRDAVEQYEEECELIAQRERWERDYEAAKSAMPTFAMHKATDTTWMNLIDTLAAAHNIKVTGLRSDKSVEGEGDVIEQTLHVSGGKGALKSLVELMYELQTTDQGTFNFEELHVRRAGSRNFDGYLNIDFDLKCAFMRNDD